MANGTESGLLPGVERGGANPLNVDTPNRGESPLSRWNGPSQKGFVRGIQANIAQKAGALNDRGQDVLRSVREVIPEKGEARSEAQRVIPQGKGVEPQLQPTPQKSAKKESSGWWSSFGDTLVGAWHGAVKLVKDVAPPCVEGVCKAASKVKSAVAGFVVEAAPKVLEGVGNVASFVSGYSLVKWCYNNPEKIVPTILSVGRSIGGAISTVAGGVKDLVVGSLTLLGNGIVGAIQLAWAVEKAVIGGIINAALHPIDTFNSIVDLHVRAGAAILRAWDSVLETGKVVGPLLGNAAIGLGKLIVNSNIAVFNGLVNLVIHPVDSINSIIEFGSKAWTKIKDFSEPALVVAGLALEALKNGAVWCYENPELILGALSNGIKSAASFAGSAIEAGLAPIYRGAVAFINGEISLKDIAIGIAGASKSIFLFACEMTGLTDLCRTGYSVLLALDAYGKGDTQAAMGHLGDALFHGALAGFAVFTIGSAGVFAPVLLPLKAGMAAIRGCSKLLLRRGAEQLIKGGVREFLAAEAGNIGKLTVESLKSVSQDIFDKRAVSLADDLGQKLSKQVGKLGHEALDATKVTELADTVGFKQGKAFMKELKVRELVGEHGKVWVNDVAKLKVDDLASYVAKSLNKSPDEAFKIASEFKSILTKPHYKEAAKELMTDSITENVQKSISERIKQVFEDRFKAGLKGEITDQNGRLVKWSENLKDAVEQRAKSLGQSVDQVVDDVVRAGWEGIESGLKRALRLAVRAGLDDAFKALKPEEPRKKLKLKPSMPSTEESNRDQFVNTSEELRKRFESNVIDTAALAGVKGVVGANYREIEVRDQSYVDYNGNLVRVVSKFVDERLTDKMEIVVSAVDPKRKEKKYADNKEPPSFGGSVVTVADKPKSPAGRAQRQTSKDLAS
jgi:hypothetical protein